MNIEQNKDNKLWRLAKKRVGFRWNLISYLITNLVLIAVWFMSGRGSFWPAWVIVFWGLALLAQYFRLFHFGSVEDEYKKLKQKQERDKTHIGK